MLSEISYSKVDFDKGKQEFYRELKEINDIGLLLNAGRLSIGIGDREFGLLVLQQMIDVNSFDQRTIALTLQLAEEWDSSDLWKIGYALKLKLRN
jgi:hypothetical protein